MTRDAEKHATVGWQENYNNKSLSGIEVRDQDGKLVNFINIRHDEILENKAPHRIQIRLDENAEPILPPPQTFDEIIQAKRRHQMLLYGSGASSSSSSSAPPAATATTSAPVALTPSASNQVVVRKAKPPVAPPTSTVKNKDIRAMLKSTPPGHSIILPDGTIIKKSRRGGARPGAGRKRSRPLPGGPQSSS